MMHSQRPSIFGVCIAGLRNVSERAHPTTTAQSNEQKPKEHPPAPVRFTAREAYTKN